MSITQRPSNAKPFDETELRWCLFGINPLTGKEEWLETVDKSQAEAHLLFWNNFGVRLELKQMTRGEIRKRFGEPEWIDWHDVETNEYLYTSISRNGFFGIYKKGGDDK